ncbi:hypothetical protein V6N13_074512 [Hibiscus sabdariffa]
MSVNLRFDLLELGDEVNFQFGSVGMRDEERTICIIGLPQDVKERELRKMMKEYSYFEDFTMDYEQEEPVCFARFAYTKHAFKAM